VTALDRRLTRLRQSLPPPPPPPRAFDFGRFSPDQQARWEQLSERFAAVGLSGLTDAEVMEIADLEALREREDQQ
jgi:hypothetical protein